jgi:hypothetical protein
MVALLSYAISRLEFLSRRCNPHIVRFGRAAGRLRSCIGGCFHVKCPATSQQTVRFRLAEVGDDAESRGHNSKLLGFRERDNLWGPQLTKSPALGGADLADSQWTARTQARESSDRPILNAFCRVAPSVRFSVLAIRLAGVFFLARVFNSRRCSAVHARRFVAFLAIYKLHMRRATL